MKHSFEDAEQLINNVLLLSTLTLGFSISQLATVDHNGLVEGDLRNIMSNLARAQGEFWSSDPESTCCAPSSLQYVRDGQYAIICAALSVLIGLACSFSLYLSGSREDASAFHQWIKWYSFPLLASYALFFSSIILWEFSST